MGGNTPMQLVFRTVGMPRVDRIEDGIVDIEFDLSDLTGLAAASMMRDRMATRAALDPLFAPKHVVLIGDGGRGTAIARRVRGTLGALYRGRVSIVDPTAHPEPGSWPRVGDIEDSTPDLAVVATPAADVESALTECARAGVRTAIVVSTEPTALFEQMPSLRPLAHRLGMRVLGPTAYFASPRLGVLCASTPRKLCPGGIAVAIESTDMTRVNAVVDSLARRGIGVHSLVASDERSDIQVADLLVRWSADPAIDAVALCLEDLPTSRRFSHAVRMAALAKPVLVSARAVERDVDGLIRTESDSEIVQVLRQLSSAPNLAAFAFRDEWLRWRGQAEADPESHYAAHPIRP
jgi:succinyl-CoA synthetase alpha subunit